MSQYRVITVFLVFVFLFLTSCRINKNKSYTVYDHSFRPKIDGIVDSIWNSIEIQPIDGSINGEIDWDGPDDLSAFFRCFRNNKDVYFLIEVFDDIGRAYENDNIEYWENDNVELFYSNSVKSSKEGLTKGDTICYFNFTFNKSTLLSSNTIFESSNIIKIPSKNSEGILFERCKNDKGYILEIFFPENIGFYPNHSNIIGFNIELTDNDNDEKERGFIKGRETNIAWAYKSVRNSWQETINYGELVFE